MTPLLHMRNFIKEKKNEIVNRIKNLDGDPHFIALGMGAGVFAAATPTLPFQTFIAIGTAFVLRGSKAASIIGSLIVIPVIPIFYFGGFKIGMLFLQDSPLENIESQSIMELFQMGSNVAGAIMAGGAIIGVIFGVITYFITLRIFILIRSKQKG